VEDRSEEALSEALDDDSVKVTTWEPVRVGADTDFKGDGFSLLTDEELLDAESEGIAERVAIPSVPADVC